MLFEERSMIEPQSNIELKFFRILSNLSMIQTRQPGQNVEMLLNYYIAANLAVLSAHGKQFFSSLVPVELPGI